MRLARRSQKVTGIRFVIVPCGPEGSLSLNNLRIDEKETDSYKTGTYPDKTTPDLFGLVLFCSRDK